MADRGGWTLGNKNYVNWLNDLNAIDGGALPIYLPTLSQSLVHFVLYSEDIS